MTTLYELPSSTRTHVDHRKKQHYFAYEERAHTLTYTGNTYALTLIFIGQFIFLNFGYLIGAIITVISVITLFVEILINAVETHYLDANDFRRLNTTLKVHYWLNHVFLIVNAPFFVWTIVLMFQDKNGAPI